jgi:hypothetical protein
VTNKIRSAHGPLIGDYEKELRFGGIERDLIGFWVLEFGGTSSEKGNTRKSTENRVTRCGFLFWGNFRRLR